MPPRTIKSYASFLQFLLALGPAVQVLWPKIQAAIKAFSELYAAGKELFPAATIPTDEPQGDTLSLVTETRAIVDGEVTEAELLEAEAELGARIAGPTALFDGSVFRGLWVTLSQHPEAVAALATVLRALIAAR
jgi:hypothetical protein